MIGSLEWREDNAALRIDSEYQKKEHLRAIRKVQSRGAIQLGSDNPTIIHPQELPRNYVDENGTWFLRAQNVRPLSIETTNRVFISNSDANKLPRNTIDKDDLLITRTGANRGQCALYDLNEVAIASSHTFILRPNGLSPKFLAVFLNTSFGIAQIDKGVYGAVQPEIAPYYLKNIWVPDLSSALTTRIGGLVDVSRQEMAASKDQTLQAEEKLLSVLGLADWTPPEPLAYTARLSDFMLAKRLDAQFHKPKFHELEAIHQDRFELLYLDGCLKKGRTVPYKESGDVPMIRSGDLSDIEDEARLLRASSTEKIFFLEKGDVLISSIGFGSIGKVQVFEKEGRFGTVSEVTVIRQSELNPYYLAAYLRSEAGQLQIDRYITGATGQLHLYPKDVEKFFIPVLDEDTQKEFEQLHMHSLVAKKNSASLLEAAKRAVEIAVEDGEPAALAYLDAIEGVA